MLFLPWLILVVLASSINFCQATFKFSGNDASIDFSSASSKLDLKTNITGFAGALNLNNTSSIVTGSGAITFDKGSLRVSNDTLDLSGATYTSGNLITLANGNTLSVSAGTSVDAPISIDAGATASIIGTPTFSSAISLNTAGSSILNVGIQHKLNQNINFGTSGGTVILTNDLALQDGVKLAAGSAGSSIVDVNNYTLQFGTSTTAWTNTLIFKRAKEVQLNGPVKLDGVWKFVTDSGADTSILNGHGNTLDLSGGGSIAVTDGHTLYIVDTIIKGFGSGGGFFNLQGTSTDGTIILSNSTINFLGNYNHSIGMIKIKGGVVRFVVGKPAGGAPYTFLVTNNPPNARFLVDGSALLYETLSGDNTSPFLKDIGGGPVAMLEADAISNGGTIRSAITQPLSIDRLIDANAYNSQTINITGPVDLYVNPTSPGIAPTSRIVISNPASPTAKSVTLDGSGTSWNFPGGTTKVLKIAPDTTVTIQNAYLKNFSLDNVEYDHATSSVLQFGSDAKIELNSDMTLPNAGHNISCIASSVINGNGHTITLTGNNSIVCSGASSNLDIANAKIKTEHATALHCGSSSATIKLNRVDLIINQSGFVFDTGSLSITGYSRFLSRVTNAVGGITNFDLSTTQSLNLLGKGVLEIGRGINLRYMPNPADDALQATPFDLSRQHITMEPHSVMILNGCTFTSTTTPVRFSSGSLIIKNKVDFNASTTTGLDAEFSSAVNVEVIGSGALNFDGNIKYI